MPCWMLSPWKSSPNPKPPRPRASHFVGQQALLICQPLVPRQLALSHHQPDGRHHPKKALESPIIERCELILSKGYSNAKVIMAGGWFFYSIIFKLLHLTAWAARNWLVVEPPMWTTMNVMDIIISNVVLNIERKYWALKATNIRMDMLINACLVHPLQNI